MQVHETPRFGINDTVGPTGRPRHRSAPPLGLHVMALVALLHLPDRQVRVQPVNLFRLQVLQQEAVARRVLDVRPQATADQNRPDNGLKEAERGFDFD